MEDLLDNERMGFNIRRMRESLNLTQQDAADEIGLSRNTYGKIERGQEAIFKPYIEDLAKLYGVSKDELVFGYSRSQMQTGVLKDEKDRITNELSAKLSAALEEIERLKEDNKYLKDSMENYKEISERLKEINDWLKKRLDKENND